MTRLATEVAKAGRVAEPDVLGAQLGGDARCPLWGQQEQPGLRLQDRTQGTV